MPQIPKSSQSFGFRRSKNTNVTLSQPDQKPWTFQSSVTCLVSAIIISYTRENIFLRRYIQWTDWFLFFSNKKRTKVFEITLCWTRLTVLNAKVWQYQCFSNLSYLINYYGIESWHMHFDANHVGPILYQFCAKFYEFVCTQFACLGFQDRPNVKWS